LPQALIIVYIYDAYDINSSYLNDQFPLLSPLPNIETLPWRNLPKYNLENQ